MNSLVKSDQPNSTARAVVIHANSILLMKRNNHGRQYYALPGGHIEKGETADQTVLRELKEETSLTLKNPKLVFIEEPAGQYGTQYIFSCDYQDGEAKLRADSIEAKLNQAGQNTYQPLWVPLSKFASLPFMSPGLGSELLQAFRDGFPESPKQIQSTD